MGNTSQSCVSTYAAAIWPSNSFYIDQSEKIPFVCRKLGAMTHLGIVLCHAPHEIHDLDSVTHRSGIAVLKLAEENVQLLIIEILSKVSQQVIHIVLHCLKSVHLQELP